MTPAIQVSLRSLLSALRRRNLPRPVAPSPRPVCRVRGWQAGVARCQVAEGQVPPPAIWHLHTCQLQPWLLSGGLCSECGGVGARTEGDIYGSDWQAECSKLLRSFKGLPSSCTPPGMRGRPAGPPASPLTPGWAAEAWLLHPTQRLPLPPHLPLHWPAGPRGGHLGLGLWWVTTNLPTSRPTAKAEESPGPLHGLRAQAGPAARRDLNRMAAARAPTGTAAAVCAAAGGRRPCHPDSLALPAASRSYAPARVWGRLSSSTGSLWNVWVSRHGGREPLSFTHPFTHSLTPALTRSLIHSHTHPFTCSFTHSFIHS